MRCGYQLGRADEDDKNESTGQSHMLELTGVELQVNRFRRCFTGVLHRECENWLCGFVF
jgi:hypothetical protein